eukprot:9495472-Pyramimonas_sp.AAC.1
MVKDAEKSIKLDHDFMGGASVETNLREQGGAMIMAGGTEAFSGRAIDLPNVEDLERAGEEKPVPNADEDGACAEEEGSQAAAEEPPQKKGRWFDYDKQVPKALRAHESAQNMLEVNMKWVIDKANEVLLLVESSDKEVKDKIDEVPRRLPERRAGAGDVEGDVRRAVARLEVRLRLIEGLPPSSPEPGLQPSAQRSHVGSLVSGSPSLLQNRPKIVRGLRPSGASKPRRSGQ